MYKQDFSQQDLLPLLPLMLQEALTLPYSNLLLEHFQNNLLILLHSNLVNLLKMYQHILAYYCCHQFLFFLVLSALMTMNSLYFLLPMLHQLLVLLLHLMFQIEQFVQMVLFLLCFLLDLLYLLKQQNQNDDLILLHLYTQNIYQSIYFQQLYHLVIYQKLFQ